MLHISKSLLISVSNCPVVMSVSSRIIHTIASVEGVDASELDPPLYDAINPDALDALYREDSSTVPTVMFEYNDYQVMVFASDDIEVKPIDLTE